MLGTYFQTQMRALPPSLQGLGAGRDTARWSGGGSGGGRTGGSGEVHVLEVVAALPLRGAGDLRVGLQLLSTTEYH